MLKPVDPARLRATIVKLSLTKKANHHRILASNNYSDSPSQSIHNVDETSYGRSTPLRILIIDGISTLPPIHNYPYPCPTHFGSASMNLD